MLRLLLCICLLGSLGLPVRAEAPSAQLAVTPEEAQVGDRLQATLTVLLPAGAQLDDEPLGPELGSFSVSDGAWSGPETLDDGEQRWTWTGRLAAYRTGEQEVPALTLRYSGGEGQATLSTEPLSVTISSVLTDEDREAEQADLADLKPPASLPARLGPLWTALGGLAGLLALSGLLWWLHRRYGARLAAVPVEEDPFRRTPPHVWIYAELQRLLERRLAEQGRIDEFYAELSRLLKRYLGGRFRLELMEQTSAEVPHLLAQAGAAEETIRRVEGLLQDCDGVKFARALPDPSAWRSAVEQVYRVVDTTKPREAEAATPREGAA